MYWQPLGGALFAPPPPLCPVMLANTVYAIHALVYADVAENAWLPLVRGIN